MKKLLFIFCLLTLVSAHATKRTLSFDFNVKSSGADFYACNAGLKHSGHQVAYHPGSNTTIPGSVGVIPFEEMTMEQKGDAACEQWGGTDHILNHYFRISYNHNDAGYDHIFYHNGLEKDTTLTMQSEFGVCHHHVMLTRLTLTDEMRPHFEFHMNRHADLAYYERGSVLFDNFVGTKAPSCDDEENCSLVVANNTDDYMVAKKQTWVGNDPSATPTVLTETVVAGDADFAQAHSGDWGAQILKEVDFFLGSDLFGSEYYVDFCYRGSRIDYADFSTQFSASARAEIMTDGLTSYGDWSNLESNIELVCNTKGDENIESNTSSSFVGASYLEFEKTANMEGDNIDNCFLRFSFKEVAKDALRPHELTDQKVYLDATIQENRSLAN